MLIAYHFYFAKSMKNKKCEIVVLMETKELPDDTADSSLGGGFIKRKAISFLSFIFDFGQYKTVNLFDLPFRVQLRDKILFHYFSWTNRTVLFSFHFLYYLISIIFY